MSGNLKTGLIVVGVGVLVYFAWKKFGAQLTSSSAVGSTGNTAYQVPGGKRLQTGSPVGVPNPPVTGDLINDAHLDPGLLLACDSCGPEVPPMMDGQYEIHPNLLASPPDSEDKTPIQFAASV